MRRLANNELYRLDIEQFKKTEKAPLVVILDNVRSLSNVGSVFRACDTFLIGKIYLYGITATPPNKEIHKTTLGATDSVAWEYIEDTLQVAERLRAEGVCAISIKQAEKAVILNDPQPKAHTQYAVIFGNEVKGVTQEVVSPNDGVIEVLQCGTKHSLNVSVSTGMVIREVTKLLKDLANNK